MTDYPLVGVHAKIDRAEEQAKDLAAEIDSYIRRDGEPGPHVTTHLDRTNRRASARFVDGPRPIRWSVIFGETLFDLRSALDHLAWQLVLVAGHTPTKDTEFPICNTEHSWKSNAARKTFGMTSEMGPDAALALVMLACGPIDLKLPHERVNPTLTSSKAS